MPIIEIKKLWFKYRGSPDWTLKNINLDIEEGEFIVIMGPAESGKSTLGLCLNGLIPHSISGTFKGNVIVDGLNTRTEKVGRLARIVGMVFQDPESQFCMMSVESEVAFGLENLNLPNDEMIERVEWALDVVDMKEYRDKPPHRLSGGQKQRVAIAAALAMKTKVLVLDDPTASLDPIGKYEVFSVVKELREKYSITIILFTQEAEMVAEFADRIVLMNAGEIVRVGTPREIFSDVDFLMKLGVRPPQVTELFHLINKELNCNVEQYPITLDEAVQKTLKLLRRE